MAAQNIINSEAVKDLAAWGIDPQIDLGDRAQSPELAVEIKSRHTEHSDLVINVDLRHAVFDGHRVEPRSARVGDFRIGHFDLHHLSGR